MKACDKCWGTGQVIDHVGLGEAARENRLREGWSLKTAARRMGITPSFLCYLEQGKRSWTKALWNKATR